MGLTTSVAAALLVQIVPLSGSNQAAARGVRDCHGERIGQDTSTVGTRTATGHKVTYQGRKLALLIKDRKRWGDFKLTLCADISPGQQTDQDKHSIQVLHRLCTISQGIRLMPLIKINVSLTSHFVKWKLPQAHGN